MNIAAPLTIAVPPDPAMVRMSPWVRENYLPFVRGMLAESGATLSIDSSLLPHESDMPLMVDGVRIVIDFSDFCIPQGLAWSEAHWLCCYLTPNLIPYSNIGHFAVMSYADWDLYRLVRSEVRYTAESDIILNNQRFVPGKNPHRNHRRQRLYDILASIADRVDLARTDQETFLRKAGDCLCFVHAPGSWGNMLDRMPLQMMGLGVCVIQPAIFTMLGDVRPVAGVHYLACADDFSDVLALIRWCESNRAECRKIGEAAMELFRAQAMPRPTWDRVVRRISGESLP